MVAAFIALSKRVDLKPGPGGARITHFTSTEGQPLLDGFLGVGVRGSFITLQPSSQIPAHRDPPISGKRYHFPLIVNDGCWSFHGGTWQQLTVGVAYEMDPTLVHGAVNWGTTIRLHLIVDVEEYAHGPV